MKVKFSLLCFGFIRIYNEMLVVYSERFLFLFSFVFMAGKKYSADCFLIHSFSHAAYTVLFTCVLVVVVSVQSLESVLLLVQRSLFPFGIHMQQYEQKVQLHNRSRIFKQGKFYSHPFSILLFSEFC